MSVPVLKPLLTELRVSGKLAVGGAAKLALFEKVLYVGPMKIDAKLVEKVKNGETINLDIPPTSIDDVLRLLQKGLDATDSKV